MPEQTVSGVLETMEDRHARIQTAVALQEPDRVPFFPNFNNYYPLMHGVTCEACMKDPSTLTDAVRKTALELEPDLMVMPATYPIQALESAGFNAGRWPGEYWGISENAPYQYVDRQYLDDDHYDEFIADPTRYILTKLLPQKYKNYGGLALLTPYNLCHHVIYSQACWGLPPVKETLLAMIETGEHCLANLEANMKLNAMVEDMGFIPFGHCAAMCPFDEFADHVRGLLETCMDCIEEPERLHAALDIWSDTINAEAMASAIRSGSKYLFIPLHCGTDVFMSVDNFAEFYWPGLKDLIMRAIGAGMTPTVFCEGKFDSHLEQLRDVPEGKVIYVFEDVDFANAKKVLGDVACIGGGMPTDYLMHGTPERVVEATKRILDVMAPGGGFIFSNSSAMDQVKPENLMAWKETVFEHGRY